MFTATELITALARTKRAVKIVALDGSFVFASPTQAAAIARDSADWEGFGTKRKINSIRRADTSERKPDPVWTECWRNSQAAVLPPSPEYFLGLRSCVVTR